MPSIRRPLRRGSSVEMRSGMDHTPKGCRIVMEIRITQLVSLWTITFKETCIIIVTIKADSLFLEDFSFKNIRVRQVEQMDDRGKNVHIEDVKSFQAAAWKSLINALDSNPHALFLFDQELHLMALNSSAHRFVKLINAVP